MRVRLLGPLVVEDETGTVVAVPGARERAILSLLAARANVAIPTDLLIEELWGADPPRTARKSLHAYVSRLRAALGALPGVSVDTISDAYRLSISPDRVDIHEFERLTDVGHASFAAGAYATAHATLGRALALWCGRPLQDLARVPEDLVARLERLRRQAVEERITAGLHCGRERSAIEEARTALAEDPYRETLWNALMVALYRVGLQAEAVAAFDDARRVLLDGLGLEPGVGLQRTLDQILQQDEGLAVPPARHGPLHSDLEFASTQPLFGRERSVEIVEGWFPSAGLQIGLIGGPPGIGKTRLAAELAARLRRRGVAVLYGSHEPGNSDPLRALVRASEVIDEPVDANAIDRLFVEDGLLLILDDLGSLTADLARWAESVRAVQAPVLLLLLHSGAVVETDFEAPVAGLALDPLPFAAIEAITRQHLGGLIAPGDSREIHLRSSGNPGVAHQAAQELATERAHHSLALATDAVEEGRRVLDSHHHLMDAALSRLQRTADAAPIARSRAPYRGLARYEMEDAGLFFGREELTRQLIIRVVENRLVAVVGASGSGKSSLVRAGLGAAATSGLLPGGSWRVEIATAGSPSDVQPFFEHAPPSRRLVIIDQFEQIFGPQWTAGDRTVVYEMLRTSTSENTRIVLVIRSDYYGSVSESAEVARMVSEATVIVGPMQSTELRRA
ncbi:MAG: BTAD domain-containing putative transcriptional regulator, partial [Acidimicrobiia bacterium]